jgi:hypothetical protein
MVLTRKLLFLKVREEAFRSSGVSGPIHRPGDLLLGIDRWIGWKRPLQRPARSDQAEG